MQPRLIFSTLALSASSLLYSQGGYLDTGFGNNGVSLTDVSGTADQAVGLNQSSDGKYHASVYTLSNFEFRGVSLRLLNDGTPDPDYGTNGAVIYGQPGENYLPEGVETTADNKSIHYGSIEAGTIPFAYVRKFNTDGTADLSFNGTGSLHYIVANTQTIAESVKRLSSSNDMLLGLRDGQNIRLRKVNEFGATITGWGNNGDVVIDELDPLSLERIELDLNNDIYVFGSSHEPGNSNMIIAKFDQNGNPITTFGNNGIATIDQFNGTELMLGGTIQDDGKILCTGFINDQGFEIGTLRRLNTDGSLDMGFGVNGVWNLDLFTEDERLVGVEYIDDKIYVGGMVDDGTSQDLFTGSLNYNGTWNTVYASGIGYMKEDLFSASLLDIARDFIKDSEFNFLLGGGTDAAGNGDQDAMVVRIHSGINVGMNEESHQVNNIKAFPDPSFNDDLSLTFTLKESQTVRVSIHELSGKQVAELSRFDQLTAGKHTVNVQLPGALAPGTYLIGIGSEKITRFTTIRILE